MDHDGDLGVCWVGEVVPVEWDGECPAFVTLKRGACFLVCGVAVMPVNGAAFVVGGGCGVGGGRGEPNDQPHSNGGEDSFFQGDLTFL